MRARSLTAISIVALPLAAAMAAHGALAQAPVASPLKPAAATCNRSQFRVAVDVGHTAEAYGAISARNAREYDFNFELAWQVDHALIDAGFPRTVLLVADGDARASLFKRVAAVNRQGANLLLSIHHDSVPDKFLENWEFDGHRSHFSDRFSGHSLFVSIQNPAYKASVDFGHLLGEELKERGLQYAHHYTEAFMGHRRRQLVDAEAGVYRYDQLIVLRMTQMPAVLLEAGSIINRDQEVELSTSERRDMISSAVVAAVEAYCESHAQQREMIARAPAVAHGPAVAHTPVVAHTAVVARTPVVAHGTVAARGVLPTIVRMLTPKPAK
jgi:N-acetylmuramoyl-L-alanine amidase